MLSRRWGNRGGRIHLQHLWEFDNSASCGYGWISKSKVIDIGNRKLCECRSSREQLPEKWLLMCLKKEIVTVGNKT